MGADKGYDVRSFVEALRKDDATPHIARKVRGSALDDRTTRHETYKVSQRSRSDRWQVSSGGGQSPLFSRDGRELFFGLAGSLKRVVIETAPVFRAGPVETVLAGPYVQGRTDERQYDVSPDARRFLMLKEAAPTDDGGDNPRLMVVLGWGDELPRLSSSSR